MVHDAGMTQKMAKKKVIGRPFQKGNCANPNGADAHNPLTKAIRRMTHDEISDIGSMLLKGNLEAIQAAAIDPESSVLKVWICSVAIKAIEKGDAAALNQLLDRFVGKVKETQDVRQEIKVIFENYTSKKGLSHDDT